MSSWWQRVEQRIAKARVCLARRAKEVASEGAVVVRASGELGERRHHRLPVALLRAHVVGGFDALHEGLDKRAGELEPVHRVTSVEHLPPASASPTDSYAFSQTPSSALSPTSLHARPIAIA